MKVREATRKYTILLLIITGIFFISCNPETPESKGYGTLVINTVSERTLQPENDSRDIYCYDIYGREKGSGEEFSCIDRVYNNASCTIEDIEAGEYEVYITGFNKDMTAILKSDVKTVSIVSNHITSEVFRLNRYIDGKGHFNYTFYVPKNDQDVSYVAFMLADEFGNKLQGYENSSPSYNDSYRCYSFGLDLDAGSYTFGVVMLDSDHALIGVMHAEALRIFRNTTSTGSLLWDKEFYPLPSAPEFDISEGYCKDGQLLRLSSSNKNAEIYYTTDGSEPSAESDRYLNPIVIDRCMTIKAVSIVEGLMPSEVSERSYKVKAEAPVFSIKDKSVVDDEDLRITTATAGASIIYTTDGSEPSYSNGTVYTEPFTIKHMVTVKAIAVKDGLESSDVSSAEYYAMNETSSDEYFSITQEGAISLNADYKGALPEVLILPSKLNEIEVSKIAANGFAGEKRIVNIAIPSTVESIGKNAFRGCTNIESIDISEYVSAIDKSAFSKWTENQRINDYSGLIKTDSLVECNARIYATVTGTQVVYGYAGMSNLYGIYMKNNITEIAANAFSGCVNLEEFSLPEYVTSIGELAFNDCRNIRSITIPAVMKEVSSDAFRGWTKEQAIIDNRNAITERFKECDARIYTRVPSNTAVITKDMVRGREDIYGLEIPSSVESINDNAFEGTSIESIVIPFTVKSLGTEIFKGWNDSQKAEIIYGGYEASVNNSKTPFTGSSAVYSVSFEKGVSSINENAFRGMKSLDSVSIPDTVKSIGASAFKGTSIRSISLGNNVRRIGDECFEDCEALMEVNLGESISNIPKKAFNNTPRLSSIIAPNAMGDATVTIRIPLKQLVVSAMDVRIYPTYGTCFDAFEKRLSRDEETIEDGYRVFTYTIPEALALYYTADISMENFKGKNVGTKKTVDNLIYSGSTISITVSDSSIHSDYLSAPVISPSSGTILDGNEIAISSDSADAIYYTLDGTEPTEFNGTRYTEPIVLHSLKTIKAVAVKEGYPYSSISMSNYSKIQAAAPVFSFDPSVIDQAKQTVELSTATVDAEIKYTLDGSDPVSKGKVYTAPIEIAKTTRIKAVACKSGFVNSEIADKTIIITIPEHEIETPVVRKLTIKNTVSADGVRFDAVLTPNTSGVIYKWYIDGEYVGVGSYYKFSGSLGYHIIEVQAYADGRSYSAYEINNYYQVELNGQWVKDTSYSNPDPSLYDGVYKSNSNYHVPNSTSTMRIRVSGPGIFHIYVRSNAESTYDYVNVYTLDSTSVVKYSSRGNQNASKGIDGYTKVAFSIPDDNEEHVITITYRKDDSGDNGEDMAFVLIPKY